MDGHTETDRQTDKQMDGQGHNNAGCSVHDAKRCIIK